MRQGHLVASEWAWSRYDEAANKDGGGLKMPVPIMTTAAASIICTLNMDYLTGSGGGRGSR